MLLISFTILAQSQTGYFSGKKLKGFTGEVSAIGEYGLMNSGVFDQDITYNYTLRGNSSITLFNALPVRVDFSYSKIKIFGGLNNYFNLSIDTSALSKLTSKYDENYLKKIDLEMNKLGELEQKLTQKKYYNSSQDIPNDIDTSSVSGFKDSLDLSADELFEDYENIDKNINEEDDFEITEDLKDKANDYKDYFDNIDLSKITSSDTIDNVLQKIEDYSEILNTLEDNAEKYSSSSKQKFSNFLGGIDKFGIGRVYPEVGEFLMQRVPLNGIQVGYNYKNFEFEVVYGKRTHVGTLSSNVVDQTVQNQKNPFNFFNFSNIEGGFNVGTLKLGYNNKKNVNVFLGFLIGSGNSDVHDSIISEMSSNGSNLNRSNTALELGSNFKIAENHKLSLSVSKSATSSNGIDSLWNLISDDLFDFSQNAYAIKSEYAAKIKKAKLSYSTSVSWLSPLYNSFGSIYMQANQIRWKSKIKKSFGKKTKVKLSYQLNKGLDTVANLELHNIQLQSSFKINRHFQMMVLYNPVISKFEYDPFVNYYDSLSNQIDLNSNELNLSHLGFLNFTIIPKYNKVYSFIGLNLSSVMLQSSENKFLYYNQASLSYDVQFNEVFALTSFLSWYNTNSDVLDFENQFTLSETLSVSYKNLSLSFTGQLNYDNVFDYGLNLDARYQFKYGISLSTSLRKIARTGFNYYQNDLIEQFPYSFSLGIHYKW